MMPLTSGAALPSPVPAVSSRDDEIMAMLSQGAAAMQTLALLTSAGGPRTPAPAPAFKDKKRRGNKHNLSKARLDFNSSEQPV